MRQFFLFFIAVAAALLLGGCRSHKTLASETGDTLRVEYRERVILVRDTVTVEIPHQTAERHTTDSVSHLENDYAQSDARINPDGSLTHTLETKPQKVAVPFERQDTERETVREASHTERETDTVTEYVEKPLTWYQQTQIYGFWACIILLAVTYRRKIFEAAVRLFLKK